MADWFKFYDDFLEDKRVLSLINLNSHYANVYVLLLSKTRGGKKLIDLSLWEIDCRGIGLALNIDWNVVSAALEAIQDVGLLHLNGLGKGNVSHWHKERCRYIPKNLKALVLKTMGSFCQWCGSENKLEFDHIIPVSKGGKTVFENLQPLCKTCNLQKGAT
jgi:hypothetical protein